MTPVDDVKTITPESRKVLDDYRDSLLGDGVSETARMLVDERIASLEGEKRMGISQEASCAHLRISWRTVVEGGLTTGWWECDSNCGATFFSTSEIAALITNLESLESRLREAERENERMSRVLGAAMLWLDADAPTVGGEEGALMDAIDEYRNSAADSSLSAPAPPKSILSAATKGGME